MKLFTTTDGVARETAGGELEILDLPYADIGEALRTDPELATVRDAPGEAALRARRRHPARAGPPPRQGDRHGHQLPQPRRREHASSSRPEASSRRPEPVFFLAPGSAVISAPGEEIVLPAVAPDQVDYEIELAAVIGVGGASIDEDDALRHVAGYTLANDVSARRPPAEVLRGPPSTRSATPRASTRFKPMGPALVTTDEFAEPLDIRLQAPDQRRSPSGRADHGLRSLGGPAAWRTFSRFMQLEPGDVMLTGSPAGVGVFQGTFLRGRRRRRTRGRPDRRAAQRRYGSLNPRAANFPIRNRDQQGVHRVELPPSAPAYIHHIFLRTKRFDAMRAFYKLVLGCEAFFENEMFSWLSFDQEHHRIAIANMPQSQDQAPHPGGSRPRRLPVRGAPKTSSPLTRRLRDVGVEPYWCTDHGGTTSFYYKDPDGNGLELQYDNYSNRDALLEWMKGGDLRAEPHRSRRGPRTPDRGVSAPDSTGSSCTSARGAATSCRTGCRCRRPRRPSRPIPARTWCRSGRPSERGRR